MLKWLDYKLEKNNYKLGEARQGIACKPATAISDPATTDSNPIEKCLWSLTENDDPLLQKCEAESTHALDKTFTFVE